MVVSTECMTNNGIFQFLSISVCEKKKQGGEIKGGKINSATSVNLEKSVNLK